MDEERALLREHEPRAKPIPDAAKVTQVARKIRHLINELVPMPVKQTHLTNPKSRIITPAVLELVKKAGQDEPGSVVFCCVYVARYFHRLCVRNLPESVTFRVKLIHC